MDDGLSPAAVRGTGAEELTGSETVPGDSSQHFRVGGITIRVESELPIPIESFSPNIRAFSVEGPGEDTVLVRHVFRNPEFDRSTLGRCVFRRSPWEVWHGPRGWAYLMVSIGTSTPPLLAGFFDEDHRRGEIQHQPRPQHAVGGIHSLTLFPTDQILLAQLFSDRSGVLLHSSGAILNGRGVLFVGHSGAGKSTTMKLFGDKASILCDDRNIVRKEGPGYRLHGTWSHGELPDVSNASADLAAIFLLRQSLDNRLSPRLDRRAGFSALVGHVIRGAETPEWWAKTLNTLEDICECVPVFEMFFDQSGSIVGEIERRIATVPRTGE